MPAAPTSGAVRLAPESSATFEELGWGTDEILSEARPSVAVDFDLPAGASQGGETWYAAQIGYEWSGLPHAGQAAYLYAKWNGATMYQLELEPTDPGFPVGFRWSMVDAIWGGSAGYEFTNTFAGRSTNFATVGGVKPGRNQLTLELDTQSGPLPGVSVRVLKDSKVIATHWGPTSISVKEATASLSGDKLRFKVRATNAGLPASEFSTQALLAYEDRRTETVSVASPARVEAGRAFEIRDQVQLADGSTLKSATLVFHWKAGRSPYVLWPRETASWWQVTLPPSSVFGALVALASLWIALPAFWRNLRTGARAGAS
jgi:hypothetical protein